MARLQSGAAVVLGWMAVVIGFVAILAVLFTQAPVVSAIFTVLLLVVVIAGAAYHAHSVTVLARRSMAGGERGDVIDVPARPLSVPAIPAQTPSSYIQIGPKRMVDDGDYAIRSLAFKIAEAQATDSSFMPTRENVKRVCGADNHEHIALALDFLRELRRQTVSER